LEISKQLKFILNFECGCDLPNCARICAKPSFR